MTALLGELRRAEGCIIEFTVAQDGPAQWRASDTDLAPGPRAVLSAHGWRSAMAVPLADGCGLLIAGDRSSARQWSQGDQQLCRLAAALMPGPEFTRRLAAGGALAVLLAESEPSGCALPVLEQCAGPDDFTGWLAGRTAAIAFRGDDQHIDAAMARIERELAAAGATDWWFGFAAAAEGETESEGLIERARFSLMHARGARLAAYHGVLLPRSLHFG